VPTVFRERGWRVYFVSHDCIEPAHVHVDRERFSCKWWLRPLRLATNNGFGPPELRDMERRLRDSLGRCLEVWDEHCGKTDR
jgi:hypothetical protein